MCVFMFLIEHYFKVQNLVDWKTLITIYMIVN